MALGEVVSLQVARARRDRARSDEPWVSKRDIAAFFGVSGRTVERWMRRGLPFDKPFAGGSVRYRLSECEEWFRSGGA